MKKTLLLLFALSAILILAVAGCRLDLKDIFKESLRLSEKNIPSHALMAEALLYQGKYSQAKNEIDLFLSSYIINYFKFLFFLF